MLIAPLRFGVVQPNLYRGSYPRQHNMQFMKSLGLKTIISVTPEPLDEEFQEWAKLEGIELVHVECAAASSKSKKKRGVPIGYSTARQVVECMINAQMAPCYVHCLNGSQVSCLLVACLRKLSFWSMAAIAEEFVRYADLDIADKTFIENFRTEIEVPDVPVGWMWKGLSKTGVVKNHPTLKINDKESRDKKRMYVDLLLLLIAIGATAPEPKVLKPENDLGLYCFCSRDLDGTDRGREVLAKPERV